MTPNDPTDAELAVWSDIVEAMKVLSDNHMTPFSTLCALALHGQGAGIEREDFLRTAAHVLETAWPLDDGPDVSDPRIN